MDLRVLNDIILPTIIDIDQGTRNKILKVENTLGFMKTTIYFFTGTGNSLKIAKTIVKKLENCELIPIAKVWQREDIESTSESIGFVFPLYYAGLPKIVYNFIEKINLSKSEFFFTVVTSAGDITELPLQQVETILSSKLKSLNAGFLITMPNNYIIGFDIHSEKRQKEFFEKADEQVELISKMVNSKENNLTQDIFEKDLSRRNRFNKKFREVVNESDKAFYSDDNCTSCGVCKEVCPVKNIILVEGIPQWHHKCQQCLACINFCPERSIQFDDKTLTTGRYHHPEIALQEIKNQKA
ncbi:MAG: EFR1 family ferrodoxin [Candidatus Thorarchaeota archaeon]